MRGRPNNNSNNSGGGNRKGPNPLTRSYESNGPDVKIRGNAHHVAEKYLQLARDAQSSGDPVAAESYLQHAEHYFRLIASAQAAQAGFSRQPDAVDTEGEDEDESGLPDRFASPQPVTPFVPQTQPPAYQAERQPYVTGERPAYGDRQNNGGERPAYGDRQNNGGERPAYNDRQSNGERPPYGDRNNYQQRPDRNGINRRPYRDNVAGGEVRSDDRNGERPVQDRPSQDRNGQERPFQDRNGQERQSRRERFSQDRQDRNGQDRQQGDRYREPQTGDQPRDPYVGEQPRFEQQADRQPDYAPQAVAEQATPSSYEPQADVTPQPVMRAEPAPRREPRPEREPRPDRQDRTVAPSTADEAPGLPSFITTPTRIASVEPVSSAPPAGLTATTDFPGEGAEDAPKFPRRRRRTTRAATAEGAEPTGEPTDRPVVSDD